MKWMNVSETDKQRQRRKNIYLSLPQKMIDAINELAAKNKLTIEYVLCQWITDRFFFELNKDNNEDFGEPK